jgi:hypothetical protein
MLQAYASEMIDSPAGVPAPSEPTAARGQRRRVRRAMLAAVRILEAMGRDLTNTRRRALEMLAGSPHGCTESILRTHGFGLMLLAGLMRTGLAKADVETGAAWRVHEPATWRIDRCCCHEQDGEGPAQRRPRSGGQCPTSCRGRNRPPWVGDTARRQDSAGQVA